MEAGPEVSSLGCDGGSFTVTLTRDVISAFHNGFGQVDALVEVGGIAAEPAFSLADNSAIEAITLLRSLPDAATAGEFDVYIERTGEDVFPLGDHVLTFVTTVGGDSCGITITLEVTQYSGGE